MGESFITCNGRGRLWEREGKTKHVLQINYKLPTLSVKIVTAMPTLYEKGFVDEDRRRQVMSA